MRKLFLVILFFLIISVILAKPIIKFDETVYDFGKIKEEGGPYEHTFKFKNIGDTPLKLTRVKAGCGCTVASWSTGNILPGEKGFVKVVYDSNNRPGSFHKKIMVYSFDLEKPIELMVKGEVLPTPGKFYAKMTVGDLQFDKNRVTVGRIKENEVRTVTINTYNKGNAPIKIAVTSKPKYVTIKFDKNVLQPKEKGKMAVVYISERCNKYGNINDVITFEINGKPNKRKYYVYSYRYKDFSKLSKQAKENAPHIKLMSKNINFSTLKSNHKEFDTIRILNYGKTDLDILYVTCSDKIKIISYPKKIAPKEKSEIVFQIKNKNNINAFRGFIKIYTNDPSHFENIITIYGNAQKKLDEKKLGFKYISPDKFWEIKDKIIKENKKAKKNNNQKSVILDVQDHESYEKFHIKGAKNIPYKTGELENSVEKMDKKFTLYYVIGYDFEESDTAAKFLSKNKFQKIICVKGGYKDLIKYRLKEKLGKSNEIKSKAKFKKEEK